MKWFFLSRGRLRVSEKRGKEGEGNQSKRGHIKKYNSEVKCREVYKRRICFHRGKAGWTSGECINRRKEVHTPWFSLPDSRLLSTFLHDVFPKR